MHDNRAFWAIAVFAHNEAAHIAACIDSILTAADRHPFHIYVLANGCSDHTEAIVADKQAQRGNVSLVSIDSADKANAWNHFVHTLAPVGSTYFFIDGDVTVDRESLQRLQTCLTSMPFVNAAGAIPANGRDRTAWIKRMTDHGRVSGGLYALRARFIDALRARDVRLPYGLLGDDFLISALAKGNATADGIYRPDRKLAVVAEAVFRFEPISGLSFRHLGAYWQRLVRYRVRSYQLSLIFDLLAGDGERTLPDTMDAVYRAAPRLPGYHWRGLATPIDWLAVMQMRRRSRQAGR